MTFLSRSDIKINIKLLNSKTLLAQVTVVLFGFWEEHGWKVLKSHKAHERFGECLWIQAPSYQIKNKQGKQEWKEIVFVADRKTYDLVQDMIYDAYHMARSKKEEAGSIVNEEEKYQEVKNENINPDDIPY